VFLKKILRSLKGYMEGREVALLGEDGREAGTLRHFCSSLFLRIPNHVLLYQYRIKHGVTVPILN
jgi:hypothetical protein